MSEQLEPGTYVDSHWGHYQSLRLVELAIDLGYTDAILNEQELFALLAAYEDDAGQTFKDAGILANSTNELTVGEWVYETAEAATDYINDHHVPEGHWFGHHPDIGDVGVWEDEDE